MLFRRVWVAVIATLVQQFDPLTLDRNLQETFSIALTGGAKRSRVEPPRPVFPQTWQEVFMVRACTAKGGYVELAHARSHTFFL